MAILTDQLMVRLYSDLLKDFEDNTKLSPDERYSCMLAKLEGSFVNPSSAFYNLDKDSQVKASKVLDIVFLAKSKSPLPEKKKKSPQVPVILFAHSPGIGYGCGHYDPFFTWLLISSTFGRPSSSSSCFPSLCCGPSDTRGGSDDGFKVMALLLLLALALSAFIASLFAIYYIFNQFLNSVERFVYNEGWLQAAITLASLIGGAAAGSLLGAFLVSIPLVSLCLFIGISNPLGFVIFSSVCLALIGAAIASGIVNLIQNYLIKKENKDALDPEDPHRYSLSPKMEANLSAQGYDLVKVKCAIIALHGKIGPQLSNFSTRFFSSKDNEVQKSLMELRQLKAGKLDKIVVNEMVFYLRADTPVDYAAPIMKTS